MFGKTKVKHNSIEKSHIKNLIALAQADGHFSEIEEHLLIEIAHRIGLTRSNLLEIKEELDHIEFTLPEKYDDRIEQFQDLLSLISIDGHIDEAEVEMCKKMAEEYELPNSVINNMLNVYA